MSTAFKTDRVLTTHPAGPLIPHLARVRDRQCDFPDVWTLALEMEDGTQIDFTPGQYNMLTVMGVGEIPISISGDPARKGGGLVHTVRDVGSVSGAITRLVSDEVVGVRGPFGVGWPVAEAKGKDVVIVSGGFGLAPLRPVIYALLADRKHYGRITLLYGTRSPDEILFRPELEQWRRNLDMDISVTVDHAISNWYGVVGVVTTLIPRAIFDPNNAVAMVCGPEIMMRFASAGLRDAGMKEDSIYLSIERNMKCAVTLCGHCQLGPYFVCRDGPVFRYDHIRPYFSVKEL